MPRYFWSGDPIQHIGLKMVTFNPLDIQRNVEKTAVRQLLQKCFA